MFFFYFAKISDRPLCSIAGVRLPLPLLLYHSCPYLLIRCHILCYMVCHPVKKLCSVVIEWQYTQQFEVRTVLGWVTGTDQEWRRKFSCWRRRSFATSEGICWKAGCGEDGIGQQAARGTTVCWEIWWHSHSVVVINSSANSVQFSGLLLYGRFLTSFLCVSIPLCPQLPIWVQHSHHHFPNRVAFEFFSSLFMVYLSFYFQ